MPGTHGVFALHPLACYHRDNRFGLPGAGEGKLGGGKASREKVLEGHRITEKCCRCWQRRPRPLSCAPDLSVQGLRDPGAPRPIWPTRRPPLKAHSFLYNKCSHPTSPQPGTWESPCWPLTHMQQAQQPGLSSWMSGADPGSFPPPQEVRRHPRSGQDEGPYPSGPTAGMSELRRASGWSSSGLPPVLQWGRGGGAGGRQLDGQCLPDLGQVGSSASPGENQVRKMGMGC